MSKKSWIIIIAEALLFAFILGTMTHCNNDRMSTLETNLDAYRDSIEYVNMQNGELIASRQSFILSEEKTREELEISKKEIKELKKQLESDLAYIAKLEANIELKDTVWMKSDTVWVKQNNAVKKSFEYSDKWFNLNTSLYGDSINNAKLSVDKLNMEVPLTLGLTDDYKFWVKTPNPYVTFTGIEGAAIDGSSIRPKKKKWNLSLHAGIGVHYGLFGQTVDVGPYVGAGVSYNF